MEDLELSDSIAALCKGSPYVWVINSPHKEVTLDGSFTHSELVSIVDVLAKERPDFCEEPIITEQLELDLTLPEENKFEELIELIEDIPCSVACYSRSSEAPVAMEMKERILTIIKEKQNTAIMVY